MTTATVEHRPPGVYPKFDENIVDWERHEAEIDWEVVPFTLGPTWDRNPFWQGPRDPEGYILPELTLGWQALKWAHENLLADETDENNKPLPIDLTNEQKRFILWFYAIDQSGRFLYRDVVLQRLKGHGKDPLAVVIASIEFVGPCRFAGWAARDMPEIGVAQGEPVARPHPRAWIQVAAVSLKQTQNTMKLFLGNFTPECIAEHGINLGKESIFAYGGMKAIEAVTSSPASLEGNRPTLVIKNEALTLDTPIPTPSGWTTMGDLKDGDVIYGSDGQPTTVTKAHEVQYGRRVFEVVFSDGTTIKASDGHLWQVRVAQSDAKPRIRTTLEMAEDGRRFMTPRPGPREGAWADLPVDPYLLGAWLGDGSTGQPNITVGDEDLEAFEALLDERGIEHHRLARKDRAQRVGFKSAIRHLPCYRDKHIPETYLAASIDQRLELLRGLMDTDGCMSGSQNQAIFVGRERLARDVVTLLRSLGQVAGIAEVLDVRSRQGSYFRVTFAPHEIQPFALPRKAARVRPSRRNWVSIVEIREITSEPVRCISVDAPDRLFQAGEGGHVTHNTHHWKKNNEGIAMAEAIERNATKAKGGAARQLSITNAHEPSVESVARNERKAYEDQNSGQFANTGLLYDTLEAPKNARLRPIFPDEREGAEKRGIKPIPLDVKERITRLYIRRVLEAVRGGAWWLDIEGLTNSIMSPKSKPSLSRRFWYNQVVASEDAWVHPDAVDAAISQMAVEARMKCEHDPQKQLEAGWLVAPGEKIVAFFDGSKSDDSTAIVGCRISDGYTFLIGVWARPAGDRGKGWLAPRGAVDQRVATMFKRFNVVAFWGDPSHTKDEADESSYWMPYLDKWMREYKDKLDPKFWPVKGGLMKHAINFDMTGAERQKTFIAAAEQVVGDFETLNDIEEYAPTFQIDGHPALVQHLKQAIEHPHPLGWGVSLSKDHRESPRKIDIAVCVVGAQMLRRQVLNLHEEEEEDLPGEIW